MAHIPLGYKIKSGKVVVDKDAAEKVRMVFDAYLSGKSYIEAGRAAGLDYTHSSIKNILRNERYLGNETYPGIIDEDLFYAVNKQIDKRASAVIEKRGNPKQRSYTIPTLFRLGRAMHSYDDPFKQAEYLYSLIERRQDD